MRQPKAGKIAEEAGGKFYFTGIPCRRGHLSKRLARTGNCWQCHIERGQEWAHNNRSKTRGYARRWRADNLEQARRASRECQRKNFLKNLYNLTQSQYDDLLAKQNFVCAVCGEAPTKDNVLAVDHDHRCCPGRRSCGRCVRGLIHDRCNMALGLLLDDAKVLRDAADYVDKYRVGAVVGG